MGRLLLAPMEGLVDELLRDVLTSIGGYQGAVAGFVRVSQAVLPSRSFIRVCPELLRGSRTRAGTPVAVQLLGGNPALLAANAARLARLGPSAIDLNFGCPAPLVNRNRAGAVLLDEPDALHEITRAVRIATPAGIDVTAKMRLGTRDAGRALDCARALEAGGASAIVVHARTRDALYRPPARWEWTGRIREAVRVPVVANGEVFSVEDHARCREVTGCDDVMLARGAVADPFLARRIATGAPAPSAAERSAEWAELAPALAGYFRELCARCTGSGATGRLKYWLSFLRRSFAEASALHRAVRTVEGVAAVGALLQAQTRSWPR